LNRQNNIEIRKNKTAKWVRFLGVLLCIGSFYACKPTALTPKELISWVEDESNGLIRKKELGELLFQVKYQPLDYEIAKRNVGKLTDSSYQTTKQELEALQYVNLTIKPAEGKKFDVLRYGTGSQEEDQQKIYYYSFTFQQDIYAEQGGVKLPCTLYHFVRDHGLSPELNFALGFKKNGQGGDVKIVLNDYVFGNGELNFVIKEKDMEAMPALKI